MTPSMGMAAPKGMATAAPQAGLAALAQPVQAPKGMSSGNMAQVMAMARKMSDGQLAEVLQGKSLDVPQYVAMTEAMGRKSLRTAMQGQQAMSQAQQPSVKDKLLMGDQPQMPQGMPQDMPQQPVMAASGGLMYADGGGIADLPAPNMESMDMASGGIVAFDEGGPVTREQLQAEYDALQEAKGPWYLPTPKSANIPEKERAYKDMLKQYQAVQGTQSQVAPTPAPATINSTPNQTEIDAIRATAAPAGGPTKAQIDALNARPRSGADSNKAGIGGTDEFSSYMDMVKKNNSDYLSKLEGMGAKQREGLAAIRSQGGGEALMNLASGILSRPTLAQGIGAALPMVTSTASASRKEQRAIETSANEYDLNLAKAQEAAAKGDMESALMFKKLADESKFRADTISLQRAQLGQEPNELRTLRGILADPKLAALYKGGKGAGVISKEFALNQYNDRVDKDLTKKFVKQFPTFETYYNDLSTKAGSGGVKFLGFE